MKMDKRTIINPFQLAMLVSGWMTLWPVTKLWTSIFLEVTRRRHWPMLSAVSPYGTRNTSSFQTPYHGHRLLLVAVHMSSKGHRLLVAVHMSSKVRMSSKGHRLLLAAVHMSIKVHTYMRGTPALVHHQLHILRVRKFHSSGTVRRLGRELESRKPSRLLRSYQRKKLTRN
jgi:hypothetical protein